MKRKSSKSYKSRPVILYLIENDVARLFSKETHQKSNYTFEDWETLLVLMNQYLSDLQKDDYSSYIFIHDENRPFLDVNFEENPTFSERIYTNSLAEALESLGNSITEGKEYPIFIEKDTHFPKGEKCVMGNDGQLVTLLSFKHKEWVDESSEDYKLFLIDFIETRLKDSKRSKTGRSLREILDLDSDDEI